MFGKLRRKCLKANAELAKSGLVFHSFGNVSCVDRKIEAFAIKPSGAPCGELDEKSIPVVGLDGKPRYGRLRPSSDAPAHLELYKAFKNIGAVAHTHSTYASAWAQAMKSVPVLGTAHADAAPCAIPCVPLMPDSKISGGYERETGLWIIDFFRKNNLDPAKIKMVLLGGHGPFVWGDDADEAVQNARILEEICRTSLLTLAVNPNASELKKSMIEKHYNRKHGKGAYYGQEKEKRI